MKRRLIIVALALLTLLLALYAGDYFVLRYRIATNRNPFGTVTVYRYYAIAEKNNKVEYVFDHQEAQTCAHSLFPHLGYNPCWYLSRHTEQRVNI